MSYLPPSSDSDIFSLLSLVSDPEATKARLAELSKTKSELDQTIESSKEISIQANKDRLAARKDLEAIQQERQEHQDAVLADLENVAKAKKEADDRVALANQSELNSSAREKLVSDLETQVNERMSKVMNRENVVTQREQSVSDREVSVSDLYSKYTSKVEQLKALINA